MTKTIVHGTGLKPYKRSHKDYSRHKTFGTAPLKLPDELLMVSTVLDQDGKNSCTAYSATAVRDSMKNKIYDPEWYWNKELAMLGNQNADGADLRTEMSVGIKNGFMPAGQNDDNLAKQEAASAYYYADGPYDVFDNIRMAIFIHNSPIVGGIMWMSEYFGSQGGIIEGGRTPFALHAVKIAGWKQINSIPYLVIQNSWGINEGDGGLYYFPREIANSVFNQGIYFWIDETAANVKTLGMWQVLVAMLSDFVGNLRIYLNG